MSSRLPRISIAQVTGRDAEKIFESLLSTSQWNDTKIPQERDFGLDYRIEAISEGELHGCEFYAQVKGFSSINSKKPVVVSLKASTVRYWRNKLLPILVVAIDCENRVGYFRWFDKSFEPPCDRQTCSLSIPTEHMLTDERLRRSLEPYYKGFSLGLQEEVKGAFYRRLFSDSVLVMHLLLQTNNNLLFCPTSATEKKTAYLAHYFNCLSVFIHDLELYRMGVDLQSTWIDKELLAKFSRVHEMHSGMGVRESSEGMKTTFKVNLENVLHSLPEISSIFSDINLLLRNRLL